jgi:hypothetical protein
MGGGGSNTEAGYSSLLGDARRVAGLAPSRRH